MSKFEFSERSETIRAKQAELQTNIQIMPESDFDSFLRETRSSLEKKLAEPEILAVFKRLKDR